MFSITPLFESRRRAFRVGISKLLPLLLIILVLGAGSSVAQEFKPTENDLKTALSEYLKEQCITCSHARFKLVIDENVGRKTNPVWQSRFESMLTNNEPLYFERKSKILDITNEEVRYFTRIKTTKNTEQIHGVMKSRFSSGVWSTTIEFDKKYSLLKYTPLQKIQGRYVITGSAEEKEVTASAERRKIRSNLTSYVAESFAEFFVDNYMNQKAEIKYLYLSLKGSRWSGSYRIRSSEKNTNLSDSELAELARSSCEKNKQEGRPECLIFAVNDQFIYVLDDDSRKNMHDNYLSNDDPVKVFSIAFNHYALDGYVSVTGSGHNTDSVSNAEENANAMCENRRKEFNKGSHRVKTKCKPFFVANEYVFH